MKNSRKLVQFFPFPKYVGLHVHVKDPTILLQSALTSQSCDLSVHSSASVKQRMKSVIGDLLTKIFHDDQKGVNRNFAIVSQSFLKIFRCDDSS